MIRTLVLIFGLALSMAWVSPVEAEEKRLLKDMPKPVQTFIIEQLKAKGVVVSPDMTVTTQGKSCREGCKKIGSGYCKCSVKSDGTCENGDDPRTDPGTKEKWCREDAEDDGKGVVAGGGMSRPLEVLMP